MGIVLLFTLLTLPACEVSGGTNGYRDILDVGGSEIGRVAYTEPEDAPGDVPAPWTYSRAYWFWKKPPVFPDKFYLGAFTAELPSSPDVPANATEEFAELPFPDGVIDWNPIPGPSRGWIIRKNGWEGSVLGRLYHFGGSGVITEQHELAADGWFNPTPDGWFNVGAGDLVYYTEFTPANPPSTDWLDVQTRP
jgi:hypothetical protein